MATKRIGILTGGGDVPGLNSVIKAVVYRAAELGCEVVGIRRGWEGLTHVNLNDPDSQAHYILPLSRENTRTIDRTGGTFLHSSRTNPKKMKNLPPVLQSQKFEGKESTEEGMAPRVIDAIELQRTTVGSHEHIGIFRIFGRDAGYTALYTAYVTGVRCCIPEYRVDLKHLIDLLMQDKRDNPSNYSLVILSEGAEWYGYTVKEYGEADAFGHHKKMSVAEDLSDEIKRATGEKTVVSDLTYDLRSGSPDFVDRLVAFTFAGMAMDTLEEAKSGLMTAMNEGRYAMVPIPDPKLGPRKVDTGSMYDTECYRPQYKHKIGRPIFLTRP